MMTPPSSPTQTSPEQGSDRQGREGASVAFAEGAKESEATRPTAGPGLLGRLVLVLVLALAFFTASSLARNSDFWFHLRTGQLLARGELKFGEDPFAYTSQGYWANPSWLFDLALYGLYGSIGGAGLVILKALAITALAAVLLSVRQRPNEVILPVVCTTLAILAMSPRLLLQPTCVSYLFLALTLWLLWRREEGTGEAKSTGSLASLLLLLTLFALWANLDEWFWLGPVLVGLFWLGERLSGQRRTPGWLVPAGLAAGLLNPYTFHIFLHLPSELSPVTWTSGLRQDPRFQGLFGSAWEQGYLQAAANLNASALAYFILLFLGVASFLGYRPALAGWRLAVWLPFAALAAWQTRTIPFFAIVAAPITALNGQDYFTLASAGGRGAWGKWRAVVIRSSAALLALPLLALIALTWTSWLEARAAEGRRVAWGVQPDPSLQHVAETLNEWRQQGLLADSDRVFSTALEVAHYGAWFNAGDRQFFDHRYDLFPGAARDYETVCRGLLPGLVPKGTEPAAAWVKVLREKKTAIVVFYDRDPRRLFAVLGQLAADSDHWTVLDFAGQALIAGWNEGLSAGAKRRLAFDSERLAFGPPSEQIPGNLPAAPPQGPEHLPGPEDYWTRMTRPAAPVAWESTAATLYLYYFQESEGRARQREMAAALETYASSLIGLPALSVAGPAESLQLSLAANVLLAREGPNTFLVRQQLGPFFAHLVERSPALPLLAVRAARRAVAANPEDANAWLRLGQAYLFLRTLTCERSAEGLVPPLAQLRGIQLIAALEVAVRLDPDLEPVHHELAYLYGEQSAFDQALAHRLEEMRLARRGGPGPGETEEEQADRLELLDRDTVKLEELVQRRRQTFDSGSPTLEGNREEEARMALKLGLLRHAADQVLLKTNPEVFGPSAIKLELQLLLELGRVDDVRQILSKPENAASRANLGFYDVPPPQLPAPPQNQGPNPSAARQPPTRPREESAMYSAPYHWPAYEWLRILEAASTGDYDQARESLRIIRTGLAAGHQRLKRQLPELKFGEWKLLPGTLSYCGQSVSTSFFPLGVVASLAHFRDQKTALETGEQLLRAQQADVCVIEGLLALEQGTTDDARGLFGQAQELCAQPPVVNFAAAPIAARYLSYLTASGR
jgi:hypothetical protein